MHDETIKHLEQAIADLKTENKSAEAKIDSINLDLSQVRSEKSDLIEMNENLSNEISDLLMTTKKYQDREKELLLKLDNSKRDLELAHRGMTDELHKHWEAEDDLLNLQVKIPSFPLFRNFFPDL